MESCLQSSGRSVLAGVRTAVLSALSLPCSVEVSATFATNMPLIIFFNDQNALLESLRRIDFHSLADCRYLPVSRNNYQHFLPFSELENV